MMYVDHTSEARPFSRPLPPVTPPQRRLIVQSFGLTDKGRRRETNEDQFVTAVLTRALQVEQSSLAQPGLRYANDGGHLFVVADGMGGAQAGEQASALAVSTIEEFLLDALRWLLALETSEQSTVLDDFKTAIRQADAYVYAAAARNPDWRGMGTTLTIAYSVGADLFVAHVGDSRCYLMRGGALRQLTRDHTLVQQLVDSGVIAPEQMADHQFRHIITNAVGGNEPGVHVELHRTKLQAGDTLLVCSDGLTGMVPDEKIVAILREYPNPQRACEQLVLQANEAGGHDNVTAIVARYT